MIVILSTAKDLRASQRSFNQPGKKTGHFARIVSGVFSAHRCFASLNMTSSFYSGYEESLLQWHHLFDNFEKTLELRFSRLVARGQKLHSGNFHGHSTQSRCSPLEDSSKLESPSGEKMPGRVFSVEIKQKVLGELEPFPNTLIHHPDQVVHEVHWLQLHVRPESIII